jgi:hypothetical protein
MSDGSQALDEAFDRMAGSDFELPNGFVNHGPMACEALASLGCEQDIDGWARWFTEMVGPGPRPTSPSGDFEWRTALGEYGRLPEWIGYFERGILDDGWRQVVERWVPRLVPGLATALFHGTIRTAHAVRAIDAVDSSERRAELARALGYWASRFHPGQPVFDAEPVEHTSRAVIEAAAAGARHYVIQPSIFRLHGVTGAMAVELLSAHLAPDDASAALAQVRAEHAALYGVDDPGVTGDGPTWDEGWIQAAAGSRDAHQVKLVEACRRGFDLTGDVSFIGAAQKVSEHG